MKARRRPDREEGFGFDTYLSPFTWRYASPEMRSLFSEGEKRAAWRRVWLALAEAENRFGLVTKVELEDIRANSGKEKVDVRKAQELEKEIRHDLMAELRTFADQARVGGGKLHLGATSMDVEDNADLASYRRAIDLVLYRLGECLSSARKRIIEHKGTVCMAWTHLQPAEPTTLGYRFANYAQDLVLDVKFIEAVRGLLSGKGVKGAVGTSASFKSLLGTDARVRELEGLAMEKIGLPAVEVATQTYPRKLDFLVLTALASVAQSCHKFGLDLRVMQSPAFGELSEPIKDLQVGSSAMPFKKNPVLAERMCSLARLVYALSSVGFANAANSILERTLDDSAARRIAMPEAFLAVDECLSIYAELMRGVRVYPAAIKRNLERYGPFAGTEAVMMKVVQRGGNRQKVHEAIRLRSFEAWEEVARGRPNPIEELLASDRMISSKLTPKEVKELMDPTKHIGDVESRCERFVKNQVDPAVAKYAKKGPSGVSRF